MPLPAAEPELIDLDHLGRAHVLGAWRVGDVIIDPGPSSCIAKLLDAIGGREPDALALTHIHLDHAGAAGSLAARFPDLEVWVHARGAAHVIDPSKLVRSAARLYGSEMQRMWGEVLEVPAERVRVLEGGETIGEFRVAYTPGHASHHVCYLHAPSGTAFTGDVAGVRIDGACALPPTPPPDIDVEAWLESLRTLEAWRPSSLALTHFGAYADVAQHLAELRAELERLSELARGLDEEGFVAALRSRVREAAQGETVAAYERAMPPGQSYQGLVRAAAQAQARGVCEHPPRGGSTA